MGIIPDVEYCRLLGCVSSLFGFCAARPGSCGRWLSDPEFGHGVRELKILIYSANFAPEPTGIGKYSGEMAEWLAAHGHTVRCRDARFPTTRNGSSIPRLPAARFSAIQWRNVSVWRAPIWVPADPTGFKRILHLISFAICSLPLMVRQMFWRPDLVVTVAPAFVCAPMGWLAARLTGAQAWLHLQDFEVDLAFNMGLLRNKLVRGIVLRLERFMLRRFDRVSTISARMVQLLHRKGVEPARTQYFPNWVDVARIDPQVRRVRVSRSAAPFLPTRGWCSSPDPWAANRG